MVTLAAFVWFYSILGLQMCRQIACLKEYLVTLHCLQLYDFSPLGYIFVFVFFPRHLRPQIACLRWCIVTLVAFVSLFSCVRFQMSPHMAFLRWFIVALATFVWLFSTVAFKMSPEMAFRRSSIVTWLHFFHFFKCVLKVLLNLSIWMNFRRKKLQMSFDPPCLLWHLRSKEKATCNNFLTGKDPAPLWE